MFRYPFRGARIGTAVVLTTAAVGFSLPLMGVDVSAALAAPLSSKRACVAQDPIARQQGILSDLRARGWKLTPAGLGVMNGQLPQGQSDGALGTVSGAIMAIAPPGASVPTQSEAAAAATRPVVAPAKSQRTRQLAALKRSQSSITIGFYCNIAWKATVDYYIGAGDYSQSFWENYNHVTGNTSGPVGPVDECPSGTGGCYATDTDDPPSPWSVETDTIYASGWPDVIYDFCSN